MHEPHSVHRLAHQDDQLQITWVHVVHATAFDLRYNSSKTKCMYFSKNNKNKHDNICFMNTSIKFMECIQLLDVHISNDIANRNITSISHKFYADVNSIMYDFRNVPCHVKAKLLSTYCLDLCGSQLLNYSSIAVQSFYVA